MKTLQCPHCNRHKVISEIIECDLCKEPVCTDCATDEHCQQPITETLLHDERFWVCPDCAGDYICPVCIDENVPIEIEIVGIIDEGSIVMVQAETVHKNIIHIHFDRNCFYNFLEGESDGNGNVDLKGKTYFYNEDNNCIAPDIDDVLF